MLDEANDTRRQASAIEHSNAQAAGSDDALFVDGPPHALEPVPEKALEELSRSIYSAAMARLAEEGVTLEDPKPWESLPADEPAVVGIRHMAAHLLRDSRLSILVREP